MIVDERRAAALLRSVLARLAFAPATPVVVSALEQEALHAALSALEGPGWRAYQGVDESHRLSLDLDAGRACLDGPSGIEPVPIRLGSGRSEDPEERWSLLEAALPDGLERARRVLVVPDRDPVEESRLRGAVRNATVVARSLAVVAGRCGPVVPRQRFGVVVHSGPAGVVLAPLRLRPRADGRRWVAQRLRLEQAYTELDESAATAALERFAAAVRPRTDAPIELFSSGWGRALSEQAARLPGFEEASDEHALLAAARGALDAGHLEDRGFSGPF